MMLRVVLDTNVLVSALLNPQGKPAQLLTLIQEGSLGLCVCEDISSEYSEVLARRKFPFDTALIEGTMTYFRKIGDVVTPVVQGRDFSQDPKDEVFYNLMKTTGAILVTGNTKHFPEETDVMSPSKFLRTFFYCWPPCATA
jgi:putative PIN family toxin of toxin-antitoxin system